MTIRENSAARREPAGPPRAGWEDAFFAELAEKSNVQAACKAAGVGSGLVYALRRRDPDFAARWMDALIEGYGHLELELLHHLRHGDQQDGPKINAVAALRMLLGFDEPFLPGNDLLTRYPAPPQ